MENVFSEWERTGFAWEQYNPETGEGQRTQHFTGWTSLVVKKSISQLRHPQKVDRNYFWAALVEGIYQGAVRVGTLREHGDLGLGTFENLDGEMVIVDGHFFQARSDGAVTEVDGGC